MGACVQCGHELSELAWFCPGCGHSVGTSSAPPPSPQRRINTAGRDIVDGIKVDGNLVIHQHAATSRRDRLDEYQLEFRGVLDRIRGVRDWLTQDERATLDERAALLELRDFEKGDAESATLTALGIRLRDRPSEFWWVASTSAHLVKELEFAATAQAIAGLLDNHDPEKLFTSVDHGATWQRLTSVPAMIEQVRAARVERLQKGLVEWVRHGQPSAGVPNIHHGSRGLSNQEVQAARRGAETACGKPIAIPPMVAANPVAPPPVPVEARLDGTWEAADNPAVRVVIKDGLLRMKTTAPIVRAGQAHIVETRRDGQSFTVNVRGIDGDLRALRALVGRVTGDSLVITSLDGDVPEPLATAFRTTYRKI